MRIKDEYKGKTIITYDSVLGQRKIEVDKIDMSRYNYYVTMGLGYLFEVDKCINYEGISHEEAQSDAVTEPVKVKKTRKKRKNATTN